MSNAFGGRINRIASVVALAIILLLTLLTASTGICSADTISETGTLLTPNDSVLINFTLNVPATVTLQTFGFGGGINAAGTTVAAGGFDPFVGLFSGSGGGAILVNGTSDILTNYSAGCPPAGTVTLGSVPGQCGDVNLVFPELPTGTYTVLLSDGEYVPNAMFESSPGFLSDGFADFTDGVFQTCYDANDCNSDTANWALDITAPAGTFTPESASLVLTGVGIALYSFLQFKKFKNKGNSDRS